MNSKATFRLNESILVFIIDIYYGPVKAQGEVAFVYFDNVTTIFFIKICLWLEIVKDNEDVNVP